jgi:eukaryotic-like serine/threonine-protein kinase
MNRVWMMACTASLLFAGEAAAQRLIWEYRTGGMVFSSPALAGGSLYVGSGDGMLHAVEAATGASRWRFATGGAVDSSPAVADGVVYALSRDGLLYAVDAEDGSLRWTFATGGERRLDHWDFYLSDPLAHDDLVVFGSGDGHVYALDRATGELRWKRDTGDIVHAAPVVADGRLFVGGFDGRLHALDVATGEPAWVFKTVGETYFPKGEIQRAATVHEGIVYFGSRDYNLYAVDAATGTGRWNLRDARGWFTPQPLVHGETVFLGSSSPHTVFAVDRRLGAVRWQSPIEARVYGTAALAGDTLLVGAFNGRLYALCASSGAELWHFQTAASAANFGTVYDAAGRFRSEFVELYTSGRWEEAEARILALGSLPGTPVVAGGVVYFGSTDGSVYAVRVGDR